MSILDRLNLLIRSELNDLGRGSTSFRSAMSEMEDSLRAARRQKAELRRSEAALVKQIREIRDKANRWRSVPCSRCNTATSSWLAKPSS